MKKLPPLTFFRPDMEAGTSLPLVSHRVSAGFASPAQDFLQDRIDLNKMLVKNPLTTFYIRVAGNSMINAGIADGDLLVVDRSLEPADGKIAICLIDGDFTVKRLRVEPDCIYLMPENPAYKPLKVTEDNNLTIWGIVTYVVKSL
ncbi:translesion error-prone DNA polymerase V autoproteolytic subunit [Flavobacterium sp. MFBS3-15]|uniref:LexA family protein n=1 Tax=Flavobacterium sp. MFBS3-15 TaxID=2989816 RepID=UPI0022354CC5|nr:translesion error-prone DNA polymerase V autoproteolytic subunit [Flavobacterium sp. MFBS3-15]MCW4469751.1 translesion error-prone DNA polymerase V autoproteolytic subunit [Flavobacterium sp. MFBS3-15]